jgi:fructokinase
MMPPTSSHVAAKPGLGAPAAPLPGRPAVIGEIAPEIVPGAEGASHAASALEVARHLHGCGCAPLLVTRVGDDALGGRLLEHMRALGLDGSGVQVDRTRPTWAEQPAGEPEDAASPAFAALDPQPAAEAIDAADAPLVYQCPKAVRTEATRRVLNDIQGLTGVPFFIDLAGDGSRLTSSAARQTLLGAKWLRVRASHLEDLGASASGVEPGVVSAASALRRRFALEQVVVEHNGLPVLIVSENRVVRCPRPPHALESMLPGGRDAAAAALLVGITSGSPITQMLRQAVSFALRAGGATAATRSSGHA